MNEEAADLREAGTWTRSQARKNDLIYLAVRCALALLVPLPPRLLRAIGRALGLLALALLARERRTALANVGQVFPTLAEADRRRVVRSAYLRLGAHLGDAVASLDARRGLMPIDVDAATVGLLASKRVASDGRPRGVVFASAHLGPWERVAGTLVARGVPMTVLARETYDPRLDSVYERLRGGRGVDAIYRGRAGAAVRIVRTLRSGGVLGIPMDLRSRVPSVDVSFLGIETGVPVGPARIALRVGAAVVVGSVAPDPQAPGRLRITCTEIPTDDLAPGDAGERTLTARIARELTDRILELPDEWVWMHDRFGKESRRLTGA